jgi:flagellin
MSDEPILIPFDWFFTEERSMALSVNINVQSLNAQRNLYNSSASMGRVLQRLSSGLRINSAAADAAGLAISTGMQASIRGLNQAVRNAGDGLSLLGTAETALNEQTGLLLRIRELSVQAASDTNSASNRKALNDEVTELKGELDRIAQTVEFNGIKLLDGSFSAKEIQVGDKAGGTNRLAINLENSRAAALGSVFEIANGGVVTNAGISASDFSIVIDGQTTAVGASISDGVSTSVATTSAISYANAINDTGSGVEATAGAATGTNTQAVAVVAGDATDFIKINGVDIGAVTTVLGTDALIDAVNLKTGQTGVTASRSTNAITLTNTDGSNIEITTGGTGVTVFGSASTVYRGTVDLAANKDFQLTGTVAMLNLAASDATEGTAQTVQTQSILTKAGANQALQTIDSALDAINERRAGIGAKTNRLQVTISNLQAQSENLSAANARILDADFAAESANLLRGQILQQAGVAILAQANQTPQLALSLLRVS